MAWVLDRTPQRGEELRGGAMMCRAASGLSPTRLPVAWTLSEWSAARSPENARFGPPLNGWRPRAERGRHMLRAAADPFRSSGRRDMRSGQVSVGTEFVDGVITW